MQGLSFLKYAFFRWLAVSFSVKWQTSPHFDLCCGKFRRFFTCVVTKRLRPLTPLLSFLQADSLQNCTAIFALRKYSLTAYNTIALSPIHILSRSAQPMRKNRRSLCAYTTASSRLMSWRIVSNKPE